MKSLKENEINKLCKTCRQKCKQPDYVVLLSCPNYKPVPIQLELNFRKRPKKKKEKKR